MQKKITSFLTDKGNYLIIVWNRKKAIDAFYMSGEGDFLRGVENPEDEYRFASEKLQNQEETPAGKIMDHAQKLACRNQESDTGSIPATTQTPFANLREHLGRS